MQNKLFIVTGVNGIGKSTVIPELLKKLDSSLYAIHDFDERGVPDNADSDWRKSETTHWLEVAKANATNNVSTLVCGFMKTTDIEHALKKVAGVEVSMCLLDANAEVISERIMSRYQTPKSLEELERTTGKTPEKFLEDNIWVSSKFRESAKEKGFTIVDTNDKNPEAVAEAIVDWMNTLKEKIKLI